MIHMRVHLKYQDIFRLVLDKDSSTVKIKVEISHVLLHNIYGFCSSIGFVTSPLEVAAPTKWNRNQSQTVTGVGIQN